MRRLCKLDKGSMQLAGGPTATKHAQGAKASLCHMCTREVCGVHISTILGWNAWQQPDTQLCVRVHGLMQPPEVRGVGRGVYYME
jgi:hypothetical protein